MLTQGPNCTVGVWFNPVPAVQPGQTFVQCRFNIYRLMYSTCFSSPGEPYNVAAVNLQTLPDMNTSGSQLDTGYPSYIMVPQTYDDIYLGEADEVEADDGED